jgi:putative DNA primase/helicase
MRSITAPELKDGLLNGHKSNEPIPHNEVLDRLLAEIKEVDFREAAELDSDGKLLKKHIIVIAIEKLLKLAKANNWSLCKRYDFIYLYNGAYWSRLSESELEAFLGKAALKMKVNKFDATYHRFREELLKQFKSVAHLPEPEAENGKVLINLLNGTVEIRPDSQQTATLRRPEAKDFITYQLPFNYDRQATAPQFQTYLNYVLPDKKLQKILAEYMGYVFINTQQLKLEKALILQGTGGNGKSVFFDIVNTILGKQNVSTFTLESLTDHSGYSRAEIGNKLVNYASDINKKMNTAFFKQLVSGEPVEARQPYGRPFTLSNYAKLIFNCNELPTDVEHTNAFFRRFLIVPFDVTIPKAKQDKQLAQKIIGNELSGVFNWTLDGLNRLLEQKEFTDSKKANNEIKTYRQQSNSVLMFISERGYEKSLTETTLLKELYSKYRSFCEADNYRPVTKNNFSKRLENDGHEKKKETPGMAFYLIENKK